MIKNNKGLSTKLLARVLSVYFTVTLIVTSLHIVTEYFDARHQIEQELQMLKNTFSNGLTHAVWELNTPQAISIGEGLLEQSSVAGVQIWDENGEFIANLGFTNANKQPSHDTELINNPIKSEVIYSFPLIFEFSGRRSHVGNVSLYSNSKIIFERIKVSIFFLFGNAIIKSTLLVVLFSSAFKNMLTEPLSELTKQIYQFDVKNLDQSKLHLKTTPHSELELLQENYNKLIDDLIAYKYQLTATETELKQANSSLDDHNLQLEQEVAKKTASLSKMMLDLEQQKNALLEKQQLLTKENHQRAMAEKALIQKNNQLASSMQALEAAQDQLIESERMASLGGLVAGITHDVNTPIGVSITASSFLQERLDKLEEAYNDKSLTSQNMQGFISDTRQTMSLLSNNLNRALSLIASFKQVAVDQTSEAQREINLHTYVSEVVASLAPTFNKTKHSIAITCEETIIMVCPPGAIAQILTNLVVNSLNHGFEGIEKGNINISLSSNQNDIVIGYTDDGVGIDEQDIPMHFDAFVTTKMGSGGSGLGTHIMYNLVTQTLHGEIHLVSHKNAGMNYTITFPKVTKSQMS
jgi:signal transduction histidine kinase